MIVDGSVPVGGRLPSESDLARDFGVSRPSVREGLAALAFAGHVESRRGYGTVVVSAEPSAGRSTGPADTGADARPHPLASLDEAIDHLEVRLLLEPAAMASAARDPDLGRLAVARSLVEGMRAAVEEPLLRASTDVRVHRALLEVCRNGALRRSTADVLELSLDPMLVEARSQAWVSARLPLRWADHHLAVCDAIAAGDPDAARAASLTHLGSVVDNLVAAAAATPSLRHRVAALEALGRAPAEVGDQPAGSADHDRTP